MTTWKAVFSDDFPDAQDVDRSKWESPFWTPQNNKAFLGRTGFRNPKDFEGQIGLVPCTAQNGADLRLSTYNPKAEPAASAFLGTEIHTVEKFGGQGQTVKFEAEVRNPVMPGGAVTSVFSYALCTSTRTVQNEIDFEFATNHLGPAPSQEFLTNVFVCSSGAGSGPRILQTTYNLTNRHTYAVIYTPDHSVEWQINGNTVRTETAHVPDWKASGGMALYLNFWAPDRGWAWAYNADIAPTGASGEREWHYYVKRAAVYYAA